MVSLVISIIFQYKSLEYVSNLFAGIFASGLLALLIAIINYCTERKRTLKKFYFYGMKAATNFNHFESDGDLERSIDSVLAMNEFDYLELDNAFGDIHFIFYNKKTRKYIYKSIYELIVKMRKLISCKCFHFKEYRKAANGNSKVMQGFIAQIDAAFIHRTEKKIIHEDGTITDMLSYHNQLVKMLREELNGRFYKIMYPCCKEEKDNAS